MPDKLTLSEKLWVYNVCWTVPVALAAGILWGTTIAWTGAHSHDALTFIQGVGDVFLFISAPVYALVAIIARCDSDDYGSECMSWRRRKVVARASRGWRKRRLRSRGYIVRALPGNMVAVDTAADLKERSVPHLWPVSLGFEPVDHRHTSRTFNDDDEDAIIEHINTLREREQIDPVDSNTLALARALNS